MSHSANAKKAEKPASPATASTVINIILVPRYDTSIKRNNITKKYESRIMQYEICSPCTHQPFTHKEEQQDIPDLLFLF